MERPRLVDASEAGRAEFYEVEARTCGQVFDSAGNDGLTWAGAGADSGSDVDPDAADIVAPALDLADVESGADWHWDRGELAV